MAFERLPVLIGLGVGAGGLIVSLAGMVLVPLFLASVGVVRPVKLRSATYTNSDAGTNVTAVVKNHKLKAEREFGNLLLTRVPPWRGRMKARLRHPWAWPRYLPRADADYILFGDDMERC